METWKNIKNGIFHDYYQVSDQGRIKRIQTQYGNSCDKILKPYRTRVKRSKQYLLIDLSIHNKKYRDTCYLHRLIAETFIPNSNSHNLTVNHKDGNTENNKIENLEWLTFEDNIKHAVDNNLYKKGTECANSKLNELQVQEIRDLYKSGDYTHKSLAKKFNVGKTTIGSILTNKSYKGV